MYLLHQIGERRNPNFNTLEEILASEGPISFDGVYESVYRNYKALRGKDVIFFYSGKYLGGDNQFDVDATHGEQPLSKFCTFEQILEMAEYIGTVRIGYHGWAHRDCRKLNLIDLAEELLPPQRCLGILDPIFAWPYGDYDEHTVAACKAAGYLSAYSAMQGDDTNPFALKRRLLNW